MRTLTTASKFTDEDEKLFNEHLWIAEIEAKLRAGKLKKNCTEFNDDLRSAAMLGLLHAVATHAKKPHENFGALARLRIRHAMTERFYENKTGYDNELSYRRRKGLITNESDVDVLAAGFLNKTPSRNRQGYIDVDNRDEAEFVLSRLTPKQRFAIKAHLIDNRHIDSIAAELGVLADTVASQIHRGFLAARARAKMGHKAALASKVISKKKPQKRLLQQDAVEAILDKLTPKQRLIANLYVVDKRTIKSIAKDLGLTPRMIYKHIKTVRLILRHGHDQTLS